MLGAAEDADVVVCEDIIVRRLKSSKSGYETIFSVGMGLFDTPLKVSATP